MICGCQVSLTLRLCVAAMVLHLAVAVPLNSTQEPVLSKEPILSKELLVRTLVEFESALEQSNALAEDRLIDPLPPILCREALVQVQDDPSAP